MRVAIIIIQMSIQFKAMVDLWTFMMKLAPCLVWIWIQR